MTDWSNWLTALLQHAPVREDLWRQHVDWDRLAPGYRTAVPDDFRATFDAYNTHRLCGVPEVDMGRPWLKLATPLLPVHDEGKAIARDDETLWPPGREPWGVVGVSRSADAAWRDHPVPEVPCEAWRWAYLYAPGDPTKGPVVWAPVFDGRRATLLVSSRRREVWAFLMSAPELILRLLCGLSGCPWIDRAVGGAEQRWVEVSVYASRTGDQPPDDPYEPPAGAWSWRHGPPSVPEGEPATLQPLTPERLAARAPSSSGDALEELTARAAPPSDVFASPDWDEVERALGARAPESLRRLVDRYGAGAFVGHEGARELEAYFGLQRLDSGMVAALPDDLASYFDVAELDIDRERDGLTLLSWGVVVPHTDQEVWLWRSGDRTGFARTSDSRDTLVALPDDAARVVLDALDGRGAFGVDLAARAERAPVPLNYRAR